MNRLLSEFLSTPAEWHGVGLGLSIGALARLLDSDELLAFGLRIVLTDYTPTDAGHWDDAKREPAYFTTAMLAGYTITALTED